MAATTERVKNGLLRGRDPRILAAAPERITPRCEYFAMCGGCHYQHAPYSFQLSQKQTILRETLKRLGGIDYPDEIRIIEGQPWNYRNRIQLHFGGGKPGFLKAASHDLCPITHCEISSPVLNDVIRKLAQAAKEPQWPSFLQSLEIFTNENEIQFHVIDSLRPVAIRFFSWCREFLPNLAPNAIEYAAAGHVFRVSPGSFFQVNRFLTDALVEEVVGSYEGNYALDLYAGVGLFALPLAKRFRRVHAVERSGQAFRDLAWNAERSGSSIEMAKMSAEEFLSQLNEQPDLVVADPPRAGLKNEATAAILRFEPNRLVLVSCDPTTLARDLRQLSNAYRITRIVLADLFAQTYHLETIVHLQKRTQ